MPAALEKSAVLSPVAGGGHLPYIAGMARSSSRPQAARARAERLEARISRDQKQLLQRAADLQGRTLSDFVVSSAQEAAVRTIERMQIIKLSLEDSRAFAEALLNPPEPTPALRRSFRRQRELIKRAR
jgi:uncharacterized protein (DUF1778 family)